MDKHKLIKIVLKDLEEIRMLADEVSEFEDDASLVIELALNKSRLLSQELELLREYTDPFVPVRKTSDEDEETLDVPQISEPELEILDFEQEEPSEETEEIEEEELEDFPEEEEFEEEEEEFEPVEPAEEKEEENPVIDEDEEEVVYNSDEDEEEEPENEEEEEEDFATDEMSESEDVHLNDLKEENGQPVREIYIDEIDDDELETFKPASSSLTAEPIARPVMREIPKPEEVVSEKEKVVLGEKFQKERSLNDAIGESKSAEPKLSSGPISSLRAAIGLNDRFLFIREIFDNNTEKYNTVIDQLDKLQTIQEAVDYLKVNLTLQKNDTSLKFVDLLKRRFSK